MKGTTQINGVEKQSRTINHETYYKALFDNNLDPVYQFDLDGRFVNVNRAFMEQSGYDYSEIVKMNILDITVPEDVEKAIGWLEDLKSGKTIQAEIGILHKNGRRMIVQLIDLPIEIGGQVVGVFGIAKDVTSLRYSQELLLSQKQVLELVTKGLSLEAVTERLVQIAEHHAPSSVCQIHLLEEGYHLIQKTVVVEDVANASTRDVPETYRQVLLHQGFRSFMATPILSNEGTCLGMVGLYYHQTRTHSPEELELLQMVSNLAGIAIDRKKADAEIHQLAYWDGITGLPNRTLFFQQLNTHLQKAEANQARLAVMILDLDRFKSLNDGMGHHVGDNALQVVAHRIQQSLDAGSVLARMGGDEFAILLPQVAGTICAESVAGRVIRALNQPIAVGNHEFHLTTSVGIAVFPEHGNTAESLMQMADAAMYVAKDKGGNTFSLYTELLRERHYERLTMEQALMGGIENEEFFIEIQPRIDLQTGAVTSVEALLRWNKSGVVVPPDEFIPLAEETGLIVRLGKWVFYEVCRQIKAWQNSGRSPVRIAVNVSPRQLKEPDFIHMVKGVLGEIGVHPKWLEIEVTESGLMENETQAMAILNELKSVGIKISIDDFGVGYSSLNRLKQMSVDALKIDRSFIEDIGRDNGAIAKAIITLAHNLHLNVVAEGVETEEQLICLRSYACNEVQGYFFARPMRVMEFEKRYMPAMNTL